MSSNYCLDIVRKHDPDRFLLSLLVPQAHRPALWALFAFNYEIAKTREVVSDTTIGLIRLQWWREAIAEIYEGKEPRQHEIVSALSEAIQKYNLPRDLFDNLVYAREFDLEDVVPTNLEGLYNYCNYTSTPLFQLACIIEAGGGNGGSDPNHASNNDTDVVDISTYFALVGTLRAVPYMAKQRQMMLPQDLLDKHYMSTQKLFDFNEKENLPEVIKEILDEKTEFRNAKTPIDSRLLKGVKKMATLYAQQIEQVGYDVYDSRLIVPPRFMALRIWFS